ncbi:hypothetical protein, partial [Sinorhizobium meliloti]|uniref:hypothetical protein n=1 Tax=Rhizobium meliloti TaxID=382 RepID=UPI00399A9BDA
MEYPFDRNFSFPRRTFINRLATLYDNWRVTVRERRQVEKVTIIPAKNVHALSDLPLKFHPAAIRASAVFDTPNGAVGATGGNAKL